MKNFKIILSLSFLIAFIMGCQKDEFNDTSFAQSGTAPVELSALFTITQNNSGLVTITPNGTGAVTYYVFFGDATTIPVTVAAGRSITHTYAEGLYNVKLVATSVTGEISEATQQLTVTFKKPENLDFKIVIDPNNNYKVSITASALYETFFTVQWGDNPAQVPFSFLEDVPVSHTYAATGTYTIAVVALSGGAATATLTKTVTIVDPVLLPIDFESPTVSYVFSDFAGGLVTKIANTQKNGINTSNNVGKMVKNAGEVYGGSIVTLGAPINFAVNKVFRMKVFSPRANAKVLLKVENLTEGSISFEKETTMTKANEWEDLYFDYSLIDVSKSYQKIILIFDLGTNGNGSANFTWLFDDIRQTNQLPNALLSLPVTFDDPGVTYNVIDFGGAATVDGVDPTNAANKIKVTTKTVGAETYAGTTLGAGFATPLPFTASSAKMSVRVYSPAAGIPVRLKVEDRNDGTHSVETQTNTTVANAWETITFDFTNQATGTVALNLSYKFDKASIFFNFGTNGTGKVFRWDDVKLVTGATPGLGLPINFEQTAFPYNWADFGGGAVTVISNPQSGGINTSSKVAKMIKGAGEVYGGSTLALANPIAFPAAPKMRMKVFSPRVGAKVLLKVENFSNGAISFEKEVLTTVANGWEDLTFEFSTIDLSKSYQKVVVIFDLGTAGDGTANFTWLFDDIRIN